MDFQFDMNMDLAFLCFHFILYMAPHKYVCVSTCLMRIFALRKLIRIWMIYVFWIIRTMMEGISSLLYFYKEILFDIRGLKNISRLHIKRVNSSEWEQVTIPKRYISYPIAYSLLSTGKQINVSKQTLLLFYHIVIISNSAFLL